MDATIANDDARTSIIMKKLIMKNLEVNMSFLNKECKQHDDGMA